MNWSTRFQSHPQFGQAVRFTTGRPAWVLKATGMVAGVVFLVPLIALVILLILAALVTAVAWGVFNAIASVLDTLSGRGGARSAPQANTPADDGRDNVRIIRRT